MILIWGFDFGNTGDRFDANGAQPATKIMAMINRTFLCVIRLSGEKMRLVSNDQGVISLTVGKYDRDPEISLVMKPKLRNAACAPIKKSGEGVVFAP